MVNISIAVTEVYSTEDGALKGVWGAFGKQLLRGPLQLSVVLVYLGFFFFLLKMSYLTDFFLVGIFLFNFGLKRGNPSRLV